jgi:riboflavin kinase/FMN adenylyltransferase
MSYLAIGHNFYFGHNREGTPGRIIDWCKEAHIPAHLVDAVEADGAPVSSTRIRKLIQDGQMIAASRLLGRDYSLTGEVQHGDKRGRQLGFPTANLLPQVQGPGARCIPARGVYLSASTVGGKTFPSITNVGVKPTVQSTGPLVVETHLLDFSGDLYGKQLTVEFRDRLRDEKKFQSLAALTEQIQKDVQTARARLTQS